jgi:cyanophycinase-like exopeptidase
MSVGLKIEDSRNGLMATLSQRDEVGKVIGRPTVFLVESKEMAKRRAKTLARSLSLKVYGIVDKTVNSEAPPAWLVPGAGSSI